MITITPCLIITTTQMENVIKFIKTGPKILLYRTADIVLISRLSFFSYLNIIIYVLEKITSENIGHKQLTIQRCFKVPYKL